jgi:hypothetical protein
MDLPADLVSKEQLRVYLQTFMSVLGQSAQRYLDHEAQALLFHLYYTPARITGYISNSYGLGMEFIPDHQTTVEVNIVEERIEQAVLHAPSTLSALPTCISCKHNITIGNCLFEANFPIRLSGDNASATLFDLNVSGRPPTLAELESVDRSGKGLIFGWPNADQDQDKALLIAGGNNTFYGLRFQLSPSLFEHYRPVFNAHRDWRTHIFFAQIFSDRRVGMWTEMRAVERAKDEVIAAVIEQNKAREMNTPIDQYIETHKQKTVLLLGDYDREGTQRLQAISAALREMGYNPLLLTDVPDHFQQDLSHKLLLLASLSRFVAIDDSSKSGHLLEVDLCWKNHFYTILFHAGGKRASFMTASATAFSKVIFDQDYDPTNPTSGVAKGIDTIETAIKETTDALRKTYPWRMPPPV